MMEIVVLAKQVPDTANVGADAMKEDGTVNRAALKTVFNPDDLNALEMALQLKDKYNATVTVVTMGPPKAVELLKEALYRGADKAYIVSDAKFAGSDTLATSLILKHVISEVVKKYDIVMAGRQAIDGDTAQVGPQAAEKLGIPQITFVTEIESIKDKKIKLSRITDHGWENIEAKLPIMLTVEGNVNNPRPPRVKRLMKYMNAFSSLDMNWVPEEELSAMREKGLEIPVVSLKDLSVDISLIGLSGSPTRVKNIQSVVFKSIESKEYSATQEGVKKMMTELVSEHIIG
jgi:electron transfer flavoprotein beta subunit